MKLNPKKFGLAAGLSFTFILILAGLFSFIFGMPMQGVMEHGNMSDTGNHMGYGGMFLGIIVWPFIVGLFAWLLAVIYNK